MRGLHSRLDRIATALDLDLPAVRPGVGGPLLIVIRGGPPDIELHATVDGRRLACWRGEPPEAFKDRVMSAAVEAGASFAVIGGLP